MTVGHSPVQLQLKPTLSRAKGPTGAVVMLKLVDQEELEIHSFLSRVKSECNRTIPILDEFALDIGTIIAMKHELVLRNVPDSVFKMRGDDLGRQFLGGVQFMHQQNVAHLDLKPDNIFSHLRTAFTLATSAYPFWFLTRSRCFKGIEERKGGWLQNSRTIQMQSIGRSGQTFGPQGRWCNTLLNAKVQPQAIYSDGLRNNF